MMGKMSRFVVDGVALNGTKFRLVGWQVNQPLQDFNKMKRWFLKFALNL
jgi:hypothetical protein